MEVDNVAMLRLTTAIFGIRRSVTNVLIIMFARNIVMSISRLLVRIDRFDLGNSLVQADKQISSCAQIVGMFWSTGTFREMTRSKFLASPTTCPNDENPRSSLEENSRIS